MTEPLDPDDTTLTDDLVAMANPPAATAGEEDHTDPWSLAGDDADPPGPAVPLTGDAG